MSVGKIEVRVCDRCGAKHEMRQENASYDWCKIVARQVNGPFRIGDMAKANEERHQSDLCPNCTAALDLWWDQGKPSSNAA